MGSNPGVTFTKAALQSSLRPASRPLLSLQRTSVHLLSLHRISICFLAPQKTLLHLFDPQWTSIQFLVSQRCRLLPSVLEDVAPHSAFMGDLTPRSAPFLHGQAFGFVKDGFTASSALALHLWSVGPEIQILFVAR